MQLSAWTSCDRSDFSRTFTARFEINILIFLHLWTWQGMATDEVSVGAVQRGVGREQLLRNDSFILLSEILGKLVQYD